MLTVRKENKVVQIDNDMKAHYLNKGFSVVDPKTGEVTEYGKSSDREQLVKSKAEIEALKAENAKLLAEIEALKAPKVGAKAKAASTPTE